MEKYNSPGLVIQEKEDSHDQFAVIKGTEGYLHLSEKQKQMIKLSLYVQARAERGTDLASAEAIISPKTHITDSTEILGAEYLKEQHLLESEKKESGGYVDTRSYRLSQNHVAEWYCHTAIYNFEHEKNPEELPKEIPDGFFEAEYHRVTNVKELYDLVGSFGFPAILHVSAFPEDFNDGFHQKHSALILGHDANGRIVAWEKEGHGYPYRVIDLETIYATYGPQYYWGIRKLSKNN